MSYGRGSELFCKLVEFVVHGGEWKVMRWHRWLSLLFLARLRLFVCLARRRESLPCPSPRLPGASGMCGNAWTTLEEFNYLTALKTRFISEQDSRTVGSWLAHTAGEFLKKFPLRATQFDRGRLTNVRLLLT